MEPLSYNMEPLCNNIERFPRLYSYFVPGAPGMILANSVANVSLETANGTDCKYHALYYNDEQKNIELQNKISQSRPGTILTIDTPPDFIVVELIDRDGSTWPDHLNLCSTTIQYNNQTHKEKVLIPIGMLDKRSQKKLNTFRMTDNLRMSYASHGVDLAFAVTAWKSQGKTLPYVLMLLNSFPNSPTVSFEKMYVMASRATKSERLRCFPIPDPIVRHKIETKIRNLRPNIWATKWRMDITKSGMWKSKHKFKPKLKIKLKHSLKTKQNIEPKTFATKPNSHGAYQKKNTTTTTRCTTGSTITNKN